MWVECASVYCFGTRSHWDTAWYRKLTKWVWKNFLRLFCNILQQFVLFNAGKCTILALITHEYWWGERNNKIIIETMKSEVVTTTNRYSYYKTDVGSIMFEWWREIKWLATYNLCTFLGSQLWIRWADYSNVQFIMIMSSLHNYDVTRYLVA